MRPLLNEYGFGLFTIIMSVLIIICTTPINTVVRESLADIIGVFSDYKEEDVASQKLLKENLAVGKKTESSGNEAPGTLSDFATDGNKESRWSSNFSDDAWLVVDLWNTYKIRKIKITWESSYAKKYKILTSTDKQNWTEVAMVDNGKGETETVTFDDTVARYVKFQGMERAIPYGYSMYEFEVYGTRIVKGNTDSVDTSSNLAKGSIVSSSGDESEYTAARQAVDGNMNTRWSSEFTDNAWLIINLGKKYKINKVNIYWESAYGKDYKVLTSIDGDNWTTVSAITDSDGGLDEVTFTPINARYVKIQGIKRATEYGYSIWEVEVLKQ